MSESTTNEAVNPTVAAKQVVKTVDEASSWFATHAEGSVFAVKEDGTELLCATYAEAHKFLTGEDKPADTQ